MKPHKLIEPSSADKRFDEMARRAAALKKAGKAAEQIGALITAEFGVPPEIAALRDAPQPFRVSGEVGTDIEPGAVAQLEPAMRLPVAVARADMPDMYQGYALPVGGVAALHNASHRRSWAWILGAECRSTSSTRIWMRSSAAERRCLRI